MAAPHRAPESAVAFRALLDELVAAEATFASDVRDDLDAQGTVDGYRHLTHLLSYALDLYAEADAERPAFTPLASPTRKILGDNVDSRYFFEPLRGDRASMPACGSSPTPPPPTLST